MEKEVIREVFKTGNESNLSEQVLTINNRARPKKTK